MSVELQDFLDTLDQEKSLESVYTQERLKAIRGLFQDIEITKQKFILLIFVLNSLACIVGVSLNLGIFRLQTDMELTFTYVGFIFGFITGIFYSAIVLDRSNKRFLSIQIILAIGALNLIFQINFLGLIEILNLFSFFITGFVVFALFLSCLIIFLEYTSILERGRVLSFLLIETIMSVLVLLTISNISSILSYTPLIFVAFTIFLMQREKEFEPPPLHEEAKKEKLKINRTLAKYFIFFFFFSFTVSLATPSSRLSEVILQTVQTHDINFDFVIILALLVVIMAITSVIVGYLFDSRGRLISISVVVFLMTFANFLTLVKLPQFVVELIIFSLYVAIVMTECLLIGDVTKRKNFSKVLTLGILIGIVGIAFASLLKANLPDWFYEETDIDLILLSIQNLTTVVSLVILINFKETLPHKEKEWDNSLIHLYVIHKDGILLFDYSFSEEKRMESDLVSGGIVGLTALLEEIVGKEKLRTIDHGDKKLMFKYSPKNDVIFVLMITEDLIVLRNKLENFILDFSDKFKEKLSGFQAYKLKDWEGVSELVEKYFTKRYFEILFQKKSNA